MQEGIAWPSQSFLSGKVLVLGLGGGCDIITAYAAAKNLPGLTSSVAWGNTKRSAHGLTPITPNYVFSVTEFAPIGSGKNYYGTCGIDAGVPRGEFGSPLVVMLPRETAPSSPTLGTIATEIASLGFDAVVGIDAGGDSLTGGVDGACGVDVLMMKVLQLSGLPFVHCVCGLGSDGESSVEQLSAVLKANRQHQIGCISLAPWTTTLHSLAAPLGETRTPNIIVRAIELEARNAADGIKGDKRNETMRVDRCSRPRIPLAWLSHAFLFSVPQGGLQLL